MTVDPNTVSASPTTLLENRIAARMGSRPNFFRLGAADPTIATNLWAFAQFGYMDNPLPPLFKERLFVYLSRFCEIRYCIARHLGFLIGLGHPAGDPACPPQTVEAVLPLLRRVLPHGEAMTPLVSACSALASPIFSYPAPDTAGEVALFACAAHVFLQTPDASRTHDALRLALHPTHLEHLNVLLSFVKTAHYWTRLHPDLAFEDDIVQLLNAHEALASCVLKDPEAQGDALSRKVAAELQQLRSQNAHITSDYKALQADHEYMERSLQELETNLRELVSAIPAAVYSCDANGFIAYCNRHAVELWGCDLEMNSRPWSFLDSRKLYGSDGSCVDPEQTPVKRALATGIPVVNQEFVLERPDSSRIHVLANVAPVRDIGGLVRGAVAIFQDISQIKFRQQERERLFRELERSNRELSQFSFALSHDLQAPVRSVRSLTQLLLTRKREDPEEAEYVGAMIEQAAAGMQRLIESLLQYAQVGQGQLNRQTVSVEAVIDSVRAALADSIARTNASILCRPMPRIDADPVQLEQVFQNLIGNAITYSKPDAPPVIEINGESTDEGWRFTVTDNGQGIPPEYHRAVFEPLRRLHGRDTPGNGLGLALCQTIVIRHGGKIWVESEGAGHGASFHFTLLRTAEQSQAAGNS